MSEQAQAPKPILCPKCGLLKNGGLISVRRGAAGGQGPLLFQGCSDCLISILAEHAIMTGPKCHLCGTTKERVIYGTGASRLECPVHVHGKALMGRALADLDATSQVSKEIRQLLQVQES
jgi:hypothetical protein